MLVSSPKIRYYIPLLLLPELLFNRFSPRAATRFSHKYRENAIFYLHNQSTGQTPEPSGIQRIASRDKARKLRHSRVIAEIFIHKILSIHTSKADISASGIQSVNLVVLVHGFCTGKYNVSQILF